MKKYEHLPFEVILSATEGDPEAIEAVMKFYDGYISKLCLRRLYDEHGNVCMVVDADLKNRVQTALLDIEYSCAATPQIRQTGNRLSGLAETAYASLLAQCFV